MTQIFEDNGTVVPVTVVKVEDCKIIRTKKADSKDGYNAVVVGMVGKKKLGKRDLGQTKGFGNLQYTKEFRTDEIDGINAGDTISLETFTIGDKVKVIGTSKGKGFQGVVKKYGFKGQKATHGTKDQLRAPGSIGATEPARVFPGMRMAGQMGDAQTTVKNLTIARVEEENGLIYIKGALPGAKNGLLIITAEGDLLIKKLTNKETKPEEKVEKVKIEENKEEVKEENKEESK